MDAKEIDKLFEAVFKDDVEYVLKCAKLQDELSEDDLQDELGLDKAFSAIYERIKQGNFEYFKSKIEDGTEGNLELGAFVLQHSHDAVVIKEFVETCAKRGLDKEMLAELIVSTEDEEYIDQCIDRREEFGLKKYNTIFMIKKIGEKNPEYIEKYIEENEKYSFEEDEVLEILLSANNPKYIDKCIERRKELGIEDEDALRLIVRTGRKNPEYIEKYIENAEELGLEEGVVTLIRELGRINPEYIEKYIGRRKELNLGTSDIISIIRSLGNLERIEKYIERREELGFKGEHILQLIRGTKDTYYIDSVLKRSKELGLSSSAIKYIIIETGNVEYIKDCVEKSAEIGIKPEDSTYMIKATNDPDYIKKCIERREEFGFGPDSLLILIKATNDPKYIEECVETRDEFEFDADDTLNLVRNLGKIDSSYLEKYIVRKKEIGFNEEEIEVLLNGLNDPKPEFVRMFIDKREELGFSPDEISYLISKVKEPKTEFTKECIERKDEFGLGKKDIIDLITKTDDISFKKQCLSKKEELELDKIDILKIGVSIGKGYIDELIEEDDTKIVLPGSMKIGIEIESLGRNAQWLWERRQIEGWQCKGDGSLRPNEVDETGVEIVSPILQGDHEDSTKQIKRVCAAINAFEQYSNETCGGHVHIGEDYLKSPQAWENLRQLWNNSEFVLFVISNAEGETPRYGVLQYAIPTSGEMETQLGDGTVSLADENDLNKLTAKITGESRYRALNLFNLEKGIEFRLPNGTISAKTWIENANLFGGIVKAAQDLSIIQEKDFSKMTDEEEHKLECFEKLKSGELDEKESLDMLLEIAVPEEIREVYERRYEVNRELIKKQSGLEKGLKDAMKKPKNEIGKEVFIGKDRITGPEYEVVNYEISREIANQREEPSQSTQRD